MFTALDVFGYYNIGLRIVDFVDAIVSDFYVNFWPGGEKVADVTEPKVAEKA